MGPADSATTATATNRPSGKTPTNFNGFGIRFLMGGQTSGPEEEGVEDESILFYKGLYTMLITIAFECLSVMH